MYNDRELLAKTLMAEAGNQGPLGMLAAGSVIMNRVRSGNYGQGLQGVILKPGAFSPWNSVTGFAGGEQGQDMARITPSEQAYRIADALLSGKYEDPTNNATHFYNPDISDPSWGIRGGNEWRRIGAHVFGRADDKNKGPSRVVNVGADAPKFVASDTMAILGKGGGAVTPDQIAQSAQAQSTGMQEDQRPRGLLGGLLGNPDTMANLAMAFNSMRLNPDPNLGAVLSARIKDRRAERKEQDQLNKTIAFFEKSKMPQLAELARVSPTAAINAYGQMIKPTSTSAASPIGKLVEDYKKGLITKEQLDAAIAKANAQSPGLGVSIDKDGKIQITQGGVGGQTSKIVQQVNAAQELLAGIDRYRSAFKEAGGPTLMPGTAKTRLNAAKTNLMMQLKNVFELGAITGPDMDILESLVINATDPANYAFDALGISSFADRFEANMKELEEQIQGALARNYGRLGIQSPTNPAPPNDGQSNGAQSTSGGSERFSWEK